MCCCLCTNEICRYDCCKTPFIQVTGFFRILIISYGLLLLIFPCQQSEIDQNIKLCENSTLSDLEKNFKSYELGFSIIIFVICIANFILWICLCISRNNQVNYNKYKIICLVIMAINLICIISFQWSGGAVIIIIIIIIV